MSQRLRGPFYPPLKYEWWINNVPSTEVVRTMFSRGSFYSTERASALGHDFERLLASVPDGYASPGAVGPDFFNLFQDFKVNYGAVTGTRPHVLTFEDVLVFESMRNALRFEVGGGIRLYESERPAYVKYGPSEFGMSNFTTVLGEYDDPLSISEFAHYITVVDPVVWHIHPTNGGFRFPSVGDLLNLLNAALSGSTRCSVVFSWNINYVVYVTPGLLEAMTLERQKDQRRVQIQATNPRYGRTGQSTRLTSPTLDIVQHYVGFIQPALLNVTRGKSPEECDFTDLLKVMNCYLTFGFWVDMFSVHSPIRLYTME